MTLINLERVAAFIIVVHPNIVVAWDECPLAGQIDEKLQTFAEQFPCALIAA